MNYNYNDNYSYPTSSTPLYQNQYPANPIPQFTQTPTNGSVIWVNSENEARAWPVPNGGSAVLFDTQGECFYIKRVDASGMPLPLRTFKYTEIVENTIPTNQEYITKEEFEKWVAEFKEKPKKQHEKGKQNG